jgi:acyl-CoA thioester hydrolase
MGVAYHGAYFVWCELGRTELMRERGCDYRSLEEDRGIFFPVVDAAIRFLAPARYDDEVEIRTRVTKVGGARVGFEYRLTREADRALLATGKTVHAAVGGDGRPRRLPPDLRERLGADLDRS